MVTAPRFVRAAATTGLAAALGVALLSGCGGGGKPASAAPTQLPAAVQSDLAAVAGVGQASSTIVKVIGSGVDIYKAPGATQRSSRITSPNESGVPRVFLVTAKLPGWWQVLLPVQPNGSTGWIQASQVTASQTPYHLVVARSAHQLRLYRSGALVASEKVGIGTSDTPTPGGRFYLAELLRPPNPGGPYGPYAFGLSGFSTTLASFEGQKPVIGIHGTNQPQLLGTDVSHGCIRLSNDAISRLAHTVPLGTPVDIVA
jgi:lipoprotein-anchoring transpeptidase ErfK/SrfK